MDRLRAMEIFASVVRNRSYAAAADRLGISRANVTKYVMQLENHLGTRLLNRTTRRVSPTEVGSDYFEFCVAVLGEISDKESAISHSQGTARGTLRLMAPKSFGGLYLGDALTVFSARHPDIRVALFLGDMSLGSVDLVEHGFDLAIRLTSPDDSSLVSRRIGTARWTVCASPAYLSAHGRPRGPKDLKDHPCLLHTRAPAAPDSGTWRFLGPGGAETVRVSGPITANSVMTIRQAALAGAGIALLPDYCIGEDLATGALTRLLPGFNVREEQISILFPHRSFLPAKSRLFIDFAVDYFRTPPWTQPPARHTRKRPSPARRERGAARAGRKDPA